ncbi:MAG TPA: hypothetical protein VF662_04355 [Allosphingosinicella sp.]
MAVVQGVDATLPVPPEARDPVSFQLEGIITGDRFSGQVKGLSGPGSDVVYAERVTGRFNSSLEFRTKHKELSITVWTHGDIPDGEASRAISIGETNRMETVSYFIGSCGGEF